MDSKDYWEKYYEKNPNPVEASTFAKFCKGFISENKTLIELGCGNGRDSVFFAENNLIVTAVDQVEKEIDFLNEKYGSDNLSFISDDFSKLDGDKSYDYIYSRFTLHSIDSEAETRVMKWIKERLNQNGLFFLEVRSINDPMFTRGEKLSDNENMTSHYRRYLDFENTINKLEKIGLKIVYKLESQGLSVYKDDDPMLIRIVAKKE